jgi:hypothetical protein
MDESEIIENGMYRLTPQPDDSNWCRLNLLMASKKNDKWIFTDIYWSSYQDQTRYLFDEIKYRITFVFDMNFAKNVNQIEYDQYDDNDKFWIPMGGSSERYVVDSRSKKSRTKVIELLEYRIDEDLRKTRSLEHDITHNQNMLSSARAGNSIDDLRVY